MRRILVVILSLCLLPLSAGPALGQWIEPPGTGWADLSLAHQRSQTQFSKNANVVALSSLDPEARSTITTFRFTGALGLFRGVDAWVDIPFRRQTYQVTEGRLSTTGIGDTRIFLRGGPALLGVTSLPFAVALRGGVKWPTGTVETEVRSLSLSQGQRDWEVLIELGRGLHPWPVYVTGWAGYRWREEKEALRLNPGNEWVFYAAAGGSVGNFVWKAAVDGFTGQPTVNIDTGTEYPSRELVQLIPTAGWQVGPGALQVRLRIPVHGRSTRSASLLASPTVTLGYFLDWNDPFW